MKIVNSLVFWFLCISGWVFLFSGCNTPNSPAVSYADSPASSPSWETSLDQQIPLLGHRNWILVVDKAFPAENGSGIVTIYTNEDQFTVIKYVLSRINSSSHIRPVIFEDRELAYLNSSHAPGVEAYRDSLNRMLGPGVQTILHDSVFTRIDAASRLFRILVLKTNDTIAYTSVYLQLGCAYWGPGAERWLRDSMKVGSRQQKRKRP